MTKKTKKSKKSLESLLNEHAGLILNSLKNNSNATIIQEPIQIPTAKILNSKTHKLQILDNFVTNLQNIKVLNLNDEISQYSIRLEDKIFELCELYNTFYGLLGNFYNY